MATPYAPIIAPADLASVLYPEIQDVITRGDAAIAAEAIDIAIQEVKMYLSKYDLVQIFGDADLDYAAVFNDAFLTRLVKNVATWHLIQLANVNISYESIKLLYEQAIASLKNIQSGKADPKWPYLDTTGETAPQGNAIVWKSNEKREQHF